MLSCLQTGERSELMAYRKYFTVSFDDGLEQDKELLRLMRKYGIRGTFNLNSELFGTNSYIKYLGRYGLRSVAEIPAHPGLWKIAPARRIPADEVRQVYEGMELATHGCFHKNLTSLTTNELREELLQDRENLRQYTDLPVVGHAYPSGQTSSEVERFLKENGFLYARGVMSAGSKEKFRFPQDPLNFKPTCWHIEAKLEALVDQFLAAEASDGDLLFFLWGHGYELDFSSLRKLRTAYERIFDKLAQHDEIIKCTNAEAFSAVQSR